jgi:hypothetical protein
VFDNIELSANRTGEIRVFVSSKAHETERILNFVWREDDLALEEGQHEEEEEVDRFAKCGAVFASLCSLLLQWAYDIVSLSSVVLFSADSYARFLTKILEAQTDVAILTRLYFCRVYLLFA